LQVAVVEVGRREIGAEQIRAPQLNALQECAVPVYSDERYPIQVQFLEGFDPAAASAFTLGGIDHLPGLIVLLLFSVASLWVSHGCGRFRSSLTSIGRWFRLSVEADGRVKYEADAVDISNVFD
jgi:hypothetical protein